MRGKSTGPIRPIRRRRAQRVALVVAGALLSWIVIAYLALPFVIGEDERRGAPIPARMVTRTADGLAGDPLNVGVIGSREALVAAMDAAGWAPADPVTLRTGIEIVGSVVLDRPYPDAPVSPLFYEGRRQDLAFERSAGRSADSRAHVRFWSVRTSDETGPALWFGSASFDVGVGFSHYTGAVTHAIAPDIDAMRDALSADLAATGRVAKVYAMAGVGPTLNGRNGEGDRYYTDGLIRVSVLSTFGQRGRPVVSPAGTGAAP